MLHPSTKRLIDKLSDMTRKQRVTWTEGENASVVHDTEGYRVVITPEPHAVLLTDGLGREIESCLPDEFADELDAHGRPYTKFVAELYREAHRHARGAEKAISMLLAGLDEVEAEVPPPPASSEPVLAAAPVVDAPDATTDDTAEIETETQITAAVATLADQINGASAPVIAEPAAELPEPVMPADAAPEPVQAAEAAAFVAEPEPAPEPQPGPPAPTAPEFADEAPAPSVEVAPLADEPGSFGTFGTFEQSAAEPALAPAAGVQAEPPAAPAPVEAAPEVAAEATPEPEPAPAPEPEPIAQPAPVIPTLAQPISLSSIPFGFGLGAAQRTGTPMHPASAAPETEPAAPQNPAKHLVIDGTLDLPDTDLSVYDETAASDPYPPAAPEAGPGDLTGDPVPPLPEPGQPRRFNPWN